jgi:hypothetical protein
VVGSQEFFRQQKIIASGYKILGSLGIIGLLLMLSFDWFWKDLRNTYFQTSKVLISPEFISIAILVFLIGGLLYYQHKKDRLTDIKPITLLFVLFLVAFTLGLWSPISILLINLLVFAIGIYTIREGANQDHLGILNFGLLIIAALVACRFFDENLSFVTRGILFMAVGAGFFITNYWMLKKRRIDE